MIEIPDQYNTPEARPIFLAGYKAARQHAGKLGAKSLWINLNRSPQKRHERNEKIGKKTKARWDSMTLEQRKNQFKRKRLDSASLPC